MYIRRYRPSTKRIVSDLSLALMGSYGGGGTLGTLNFRQFPYTGFTRETWPWACSGGGEVVGRAPLAGANSRVFTRCDGESH